MLSNPTARQLLLVRKFDTTFDICKLPTTKCRPLSILNSRRVTGSLPMSWSQMTNLSYIYLSQNSLTGMSCCQTGVQPVVGHASKLCTGGGYRMFCRRLTVLHQCCKNPIQYSEKTPVCRHSTRWLGDYEKPQSPTAVSKSRLW